MKKVVGILLAMTILICSSLPAVAQEPASPKESETTTTFDLKEMTEPEVVISQSTSECPDGTIEVITVKATKPVYRSSYSNSDISTYGNVGSTTITTTMEKKISNGNGLQATYEISTDFWFDEEANKTGQTSCTTSATPASGSSAEATITNGVKTSGNNWFSNDHWTRMTATWKWKASGSASGTIFNQIYCDGTIETSH